MFTALTMKFSFQTLEALCDSSHRQASPPSCLPKVQKVKEKSLDKQATRNQRTSSQGTRRGLFFPHTCYKHNLSSVFGMQIQVILTVW